MVGDSMRHRVRKRVNLRVPHIEPTRTRTSLYQDLCEARTSAGSASFRRFPTGSLDSVPGLDRCNASM